MYACERKLPDLGINMSEAKALRIFRKCDTDGGGEIDLNEFKMAMFAVDPVSGNTLGFSPSSLLSPKDAFELFDTDGTGQIDELEFADVLEYFDMDVSDGKQEAIFKKFDKDKSGFIDYKEFRTMWMQLSNVREELTKRGVEVPKYATPWKLQQMLEKVLDEEEAREALVYAEAQKFLLKQREKQRRELLGRKATVRAQDELAAALDAAGQVYIFGSGKYNQFAGEPVIRDEELFPGFKAVSEIWAFRVNPKPQDLSESAGKAITATAAAQAGLEVQRKKEKKEKLVVGIDEKLVRKKKKLRKLEESKPKERDLSKFVRRRPENKRWKFQSPPKLNKQTLHTLKMKSIGGSGGIRDEDEESLDKTKAVAASNPNVDEEDQTDESEVEPLESVDQDEEDKDDATKNEELAKLFFEDREFVRSLRFRLTKLMTNTGLLWGRGIVHATISENVAFVVTSDGSILTWGGKDNSVSWDSVVKKTAIDIGGDDLEDDEKQKQQEQGTEAPDGGTGEIVKSKVTARSAMQKMATPSQVRGHAGRMMEIGFCANHFLLFCHNIVDSFAE